MDPSALSIFQDGRAVTAVAAGSVIILLWFLRLAALPRPLPGIPYNKVSAGRIAGDVPELRKTGRTRAWLRDRFATHNSPIVQVFMAPFGKPWVLVSDFWEAQDVMVRRTREFDKGALTADSFGSLLPDYQIAMKAADPRYKHNRELVRDLMKPAFLHQASTPTAYPAPLDFVSFLTAPSVNDANGNCLRRYPRQKFTARPHLS